MKPLTKWASKASITLSTLLHLELSLLAMTAPAALSQTYTGPLQHSPIPTQLDNGQMNQLVAQWGFLPAPCSPNVAIITSGSSKACVNPTPQLPAGDYTYNPGLNQVVPTNNSQATTAGPRKFTFTTVLEYSKCLESILRLYQSDGLNQPEPPHSCLTGLGQTQPDQTLSKAQALELISSTNLYATAVVSPKIYPLRGQRERIAQMFQFIYEIDANDPEIRKLADQSQELENHSNDLR